MQLDDDMKEIFESFLVESQELLDALMPDLMQLETAGDDMDLMNRIFRGFHTIKGTSGFMGFDSITVITHHAEDLLNKLRRSELTITMDMVDVLLEVHDWIQLLVKNLSMGDDSPVDYSQTLARLEAVINPSAEKLSASKKEEKPPSAIQSVLADTSMKGAGDFTDEQLAQIQAAFAEINSEFAKEISQESSSAASHSALDAVLNNTSITQNPGDFTEDELAMIQAAFTEINTDFSANQESKTIEKPSELPQQIVESTKETTSVEYNEQSKETAAKATPVAATKPSPQTTAAKPAPATSSSADATIRIDVSRVEALMDLSGELVLGRNRLSQISDRLKELFDNEHLVAELLETTSQLDKITTDIQATAMKMRMVPIGKLYQKSPRIVRDLSKEFGKEIELILKGEDTEIDRGIIEELNDPLVHMIRNSCDHGIESPENRVAKGKPAKGTITLDAEQEGNNIVLRISDDGNGIDAEKVKAKALEKGVITAEQAAQMSKRELYQLIFAPGFSTAAVVSAVSGRGVGMDVVKTNIQKLKGVIEIESEINKGTTFVIKLPLTLAIIQGLIVQVENETYALPLSNVVEVVALTDENCSTINQKRVIRIRQQVLPLLTLKSELNIPAKPTPSTAQYVVVIGLAHQRLGIVVDSLLGQEEIVIKSLGQYLGNIPAIAGSTILGDGRVIMILDIQELVDKVKVE
ncbi:MAG TPA: chemotaxis protein CheA [Candidatus Kapabacteria bacterium]|nr:chemotaxis protein CheA [Candidatus Kapabacteria bacterium]